jgi:hypothetical protein
VAFNRKNGRTRQDETEMVDGFWVTFNGFLYTTIGLGAGLASKACLPGPWAEARGPGLVAHCHDSSLLRHPLNNI